MKEHAISEEECLDNWRTKGWCDCPRCESYAAALDAVEDVTQPMSRFALFRLIRQPTGQDIDEAGRNLSAMIETGWLSEPRPGMYVSP